MLVLLLTLFVAMAGAACPPQIVRTYPDDGGRLTHAERVGADLDLTREPGGDLASLRLLVDGADVTARASPPSP